MLKYISGLLFVFFFPIWSLSLVEPEQMLTLGNPQHEQSEDV